MSVSLSQAKALFLKHRLDLFLLLASGTCFALYARNSAHLAEYVGKSAPMATLSEGSGLRKEAGSSELRPAQVGAPFYNMDAIWVPEKAMAILQLGASSRVLIEEKTLLILKRPFRDGEILQRQLKVVTGRASVLNSNGKDTTIQRENHLAEVPDLNQAKDKMLDGSAELHIKPTPGGIIFYYVRQPEPLVTFAWPKPIQGFLVVTARSGSSTHKVIYQKIADQSSIQVPLPIQASYTWHVLAQDGRKVLHGPFLFEVRAFEQTEVKKALTSGGAAKVEVIMKE